MKKLITLLLIPIITNAKSLEELEKMLNTLKNTKAEIPEISFPDDFVEPQKPKIIFLKDAEILEIKGLDKNEK